jgi:hypothetical protein
MAEKEFDLDDPMELVGVALPGGNVEEMVECLVEEYIRDGWDDKSLLHLFHDPFYRATHQVYREKGEEYVLAIISRLRERWGYWKGEDIPLRLRADEVKKQILTPMKETCHGVE